MLVQLIQHEIVLRKAGNIKFDDGKVLSLGGRQTERFAISLLNYGSLQGPTLIRSIVAGLLGVKLGHNDPEEAKRLESVNRTIEKLTRKLTELSSLSELEVGEFIRQFNFDTWWLSIDQLAVLATTGSSLHDILRPIRNVVFETGDLMNEFAHAERMGLGRALQQKTSSPAKS